MTEEERTPPLRAAGVDPRPQDDEHEEAQDRQILHGERVAAHDRLTYVRDVRLLRARLDRAEQALRQAEGEAAYLPMLQAMLKDAQDALAQRHAVILAQAESLAAAQLWRETAERASAEAASLAERLADAEQALAAAEDASQGLLRERAAILGSTSWRLTTAPRLALSRLRRC